jgi:hypothetical protein
VHSTHMYNIRVFFSLFYFIFFSILCVRGSRGVEMRRFICQSVYEMSIQDFVFISTQRRMGRDFPL